MWIVAAITAAALWGFSYAMAERFLKNGLTPAFMMFTHAALAVPIYGLVALKFGKIESQIALLKAQPKLLPFLLGVVLCYLTANLLVFWSISQKNVTSVSLIEIAYPLFAAFFAWALFRDLQMNWGIAAGAALIIAGIFCVGTFSKS